MDKRAAGRYLDSLFGKAIGHVSVAYKDKGESWQEAQFAWPADRTTILGWAAVHHDANIFICPGLRASGGGRVKGDGTALRWLWADVDMDKVPENRRDDVRSRIKELGTLVVASGSGENRHVYVRLDAPVPVSEHLRLNTGLRDYLYADNKQSDNSLLRLPGTTNWKTEQGSPVKAIGGVVRGKDVTPEQLLTKTVFKRVKVTVGADVSVVDWQEKQPAGLSKRVLRMTQMTVEEGRARYGKRHKAVWAIAGELHKRGLDADEVHTLMDSFPPGVDKQDEEHGYDLHKDVEKRLIWDRANIPGLSDEDREDIEEQLMDMESASDEDFQAEVDAEIDRMAADIRKRNLAHQRARRMEAESTHREPPTDLSQSLTDALAAPPNPVPWLIEGVASQTANVIISGQYKSGKTLMMVGSLIPALIDGHDLFGTIPVHVPEGGAVVGHWNLEMSADDLINKYIRPVGIENTDNLHLANWRGQTVNILSEPGKESAVKWLTDRQAQIWTVDSFAQLARMAGVNANDNDEVYALWGAIDEIKIRAGIGAFFILGHTGRTADDKAAGSGLLPTRGASAIDEAPDMRWILTRDKDDLRYLQVEGRAVGASVHLGQATMLSLDETTNRMTLSGLTKATAAQDGWVQRVVRVMTAMGGRGLSQINLVKALKREGRIGNEHAKEVIQEAIESGWIEVRHESSARGGRASKMHYLAGVGDGDERPDRNRGATPREVNMAAGKLRQRIRT